MKYNLCILILVVFCGNIFSQEKHLFPKFDSLEREYQIIDIKKSKKSYIITVVDEWEYKFLIISMKCKKQEKAEIKVGEKYNLLFYSIYPPPKEGIILIGSGELLRNVSIYGIKIKFYASDTDILVTTPDLKGLYCIRPVSTPQNSP